MRVLTILFTALVLGNFAPAEVVPTYNSDHTKLLSLSEGGSMLELDQALFWCAQRPAKLGTA